MKKSYIKSIISVLLVIGIIINLLGCSSPQFTEPEIIEETELFENEIEPEAPIEFVEIPDSQVHGHIEELLNWGADVSNYENLIGEEITVVEGRVISKGRPGAYLTGGESYLSVPHTATEIEVTNVLFGETASEKISVYMTGGYALISELIEHYEKYFGFERVDKMKLYDLSEEEKNNKYIYFDSDAYYDFTIGDEYIVILYPHPCFDKYMVNAMGYGVFKKNENARESESGLSGFINVITENELDISVIDSARS